MHWSEIIAAFFSGAFLVNFVPHFVNGVSGNRFPSPFAKPPGKGLSSPLVNTLWGLLNLLAGAVLFHVGRVEIRNLATHLAFFLGILLLSISLSIGFASKHKE